MHLFFRTGLSAWRIPRLLLNFLSVTPYMLAQAEERLYQGIPRSIVHFLFIFILL